MGPTIFWQVFAAVLCAGLLLVAFVWAMMNISRRERASEPVRVYIMTSVMVFGFALGSFMLATDSVPPWLDAMLQ